MYDFFKNIANKNSCNSGGICTIHPSVNSLYENILNEISEISFYLVKLKSFGFVNNEVSSFLIESLSIFLINTSFNQKKYLSLIFKLDTIKKEIKEKYLSYATKNNYPYEVIDNNVVIQKNTTISELIKINETTRINRQKNLDLKKLSLFELITLIAKLSAINIVKIKKFDKDFNIYDLKILEFFSYTTAYFSKCEKLIRKIYEFSSIAREIKKKLYKTLEEKYGKKEDSSISFNLQKGHNILVSGDDLNELEDVLKTIEKTKKDINVYTNGALFLAHFYNYFKNNKYLKGHYGTDNAEFDFSNFKGSILITQNFVKKIDSLYRGDIFCNKLISFTKVLDIENNDYMPLISSSLEHLNDTEEKEKIKKLFFNKEKIKKILQKDDEEVIILVNSNKNNDSFEEYKNKRIIKINSAIEGDILIDELENIKNSNIKTSVFFLECTLPNLDLLFCLLDYKFEFYFANCSNILINPHILQSLSLNFSTKII